MAYGAASREPPHVHLVWDRPDGQLDELAAWWEATYRSSAHTYDGRPLLDEGLMFKSTLSAAAYLRLHLDAILPRGVSRFVYIDGDVIVYRDLSELFETSLEGHAVSDARGQTAMQDACARLVGRLELSVLARGAPNCTVCSANQVSDPEDMRFARAAH